MVSENQLFEWARTGDPQLSRSLPANARHLRDEDGWTLLMVASAFGHAPLVDTLLASGADPNATERDFGRTALMEAAHKGHTRVVQALLS